MRRPLRRLHFVAVIAGVMLAVVVPVTTFEETVRQPGVMAVEASRSQEATPTDSERTFTCSHAPRSIDDLAALAVEGASVRQSSGSGPRLATPEALEAGVTADASVALAVTRVLQTQVACINAGDFLRQSALFTDGFLRQIYRGYFGGNDPPDPEAISQDIARFAELTPLPPDQRAQLELVQDVRVQADGRVTALSQVNGARNLIVFAKSDDQYLIDGSYELAPEGTPTP